MELRDTCTRVSHATHSSLFLPTLIFYCVHSAVHILTISQDTGMQSMSRLTTLENEQFIQIAFINSKVTIKFFEVETKHLEVYFYSFVQNTLVCMMQSCSQRFNTASIFHYIEI